MPITKSKAFLTSDNQVFLTQAEAQTHELLCIFESEPWQVASLDADSTRALRERASQIIWTHRDLIVSALSSRKPREKKVKAATGKEEKRGG